MNKTAKYIRIAIASVVFVIITAGFLNINGIQNISHVFLRTQFTPALVSAFTGCIAALAILLIITILFGRVYCSFLCPLGIFQDIIIRIYDFIRKKANKGKRPKKTYTAPHNILRYTILAIIAITLVAGFTYPLALLDPYSNYGRISGQIFGYAVNGISNILSGIFPAHFYVKDYVTLSVFSFIYSSLFLLAIIAFSAFKGRLYCNTICPVGTFLGAVSGISLFKPAIDKEKCVKCTLCASNCKSNCINLQTKEIDATRCVSCYNCLSSCKRGGVKIAPTWLKKKKEDDAFKRDIENKERRNAIIAMGGFAAAVAARSLIFPKKHYFAKGGEFSENTPIMPPGAGNLTAFKDACTACHACIAACPEKIIRPASFEYGIDGIMLPTIKYNNGSCRYDCNKCSHTCPHGALEHISLETKQKTQIALATYNPTTCIINTEGFRCGACSRNCPTGAISMVEGAEGDGKRIPSINPSLCIGCGACSEVCPAMPKAISIEGTIIQNLIS